jgi:hypothetical protein
VPSVEGGFDDGAAQELRSAKDEELHGRNATRA